MHSRERLLNLLNGNKIDRLPVSPFIHNNFIYEFFGSDKVDPVAKGLEVYKHFDFDTILRTCTVWDAFDIKESNNEKWYVTKEKHTTKENVEWSIVTTIQTPEKVLRQNQQFRRVGKYEVVSAKTEYYIKDESDFEQFVKYQPPVKEYDCSIITRARHLIGDDGLVAPWAQGAFNCLREYRKIDDLLMDPYLNFEMYEQMVKYFSNRMLGAIQQFVNAGADIISCEGNAATGTMVGPDFFKRFILPYEREFTRQVKEMGVYYLYHNCGDARALLELYPLIGMDIYESLTKPPYGDTILEEAIEKLGDDIVLSGNVDQIEFLVNRTPNDVEEEVKQLIEKVKRRGNFIVATSDYISNGTPHENILALSETVRKYGLGD